MADSAIVTAFAALGGSIVGAVSSFATTYLTQRHQGRRERLARELEQRELLYSGFIENAAELFLDSLDKSLSDPAKLVRIGALIGRMRLVASTDVAIASDNVLREILASYHRPPLDPFEVLSETRDTFTDPLAAFTDACRRERETMMGAW